MLIKRFYMLSNEMPDTGLADIDMPRLGRFVAIAGKNGAGKSRLLLQLEKAVQQRAEQIPQINNHRATLYQLEKQIAQKRSAIEQGLVREIELGSYESMIKSEEATSIRIREIITLCEERIFATSPTRTFKTLRFVPKNLSLHDPCMLPKQQLKNKADKATNADVTNFSETCLAYIQRLQDRWWNATHQSFSGSPTERESVIGEYGQLQNLIDNLLGVRLTRSLDDEAFIFGKALATASLSDGQKISLQLATALHAQQARLDQTVFILDEIENHLHPSVVIDVLNAIEKAAPHAQIWIATHSVPLLAYIISREPMALWYMENGKVSHSGRHPERVLLGLLGDDERIGQLRAFTGLPAQLASANFAAESLLPPTTAAADADDPQTSQIAKVLSQLQKTCGRPLTILDYGAGQGRLLDSLAAIPQGDARLRDSISYLAFDEYPANRDTCEAAIACHYDDPENRYFSTETEFFSKEDPGSIDVVVMCNVLHEIDPADWQRVFSRDSLLMKSLNDNGFLLLVEDQQIPVGEKAHQQGFLVLDAPQLKTLFAITKHDMNRGLFIRDDARQDGRLTAHLISKELLQRYLATQRLKAITELQSAALTAIERIRKGAPSYANGLAHGFWVQQYANASMFLARHGGMEYGLATHATSAIDIPAAVLPTALQSRTSQPDVEN